MRSVFRLPLFACLWLVLAPARGQDSAASDIFLNAYLECGRAEKQEAAGDSAAAVAGYKRAITLLDQVSREDPAWQPEMVKRRRTTTADAVARLEGGGEKVALPAPKPKAPDALEPDLPMKSEAVIPGTEVFVPAGKTASEKAVAAATAQGGDKLLESAQTYLNTLKAELSKTKGSLDEVTRDKEDMARKLDKAMRDVAESAQKQLKLEKRASMAEDELLKFEKEGGRDSAAANSARAEILRLRGQLRDAKFDRDAEAELRDQFAQSMRSLRARIGDSKDVPAKIAAMQKEIDRVMGEKTDLATKVAKVQEQLNKVTGERDDALAQVTKMKEAQKQVDKLMSDNTTLMAKLGAAETQIKSFKAQGEDKDRQIAALKVEMGNVKRQAEISKKDSANYQAQMATLQGKLDAQAKDLAQLKNDAKLSETERKRLAEENETLRGIVVRQMKQQAVRDKTKQIVLTELAKLDVNSKALLDQIEFLGQPVVKLTEKERKLFKNPTIEINDAETVIAAPKDAPIAKVPPPAETMPDADPKMAETKAAAALSANVAPNATVPGVDPAKTAPPLEMPKASDTTLAKADALPSKPPVESGLPAKAAEPSTNIPAGTPGTAPTKAPAAAGTAGTTADNMTAPESGSPNVPPELLAQARDAKEQFDKGNYRDAEKIYEKILQKAPNNLYILSNLGVVRFRAQKLKLAEESFRKAIAIAPEDAFSRCTLGIVLYSEGKYDDAVTELTKALAINPKNATAHNYLGITASQKGWQEAAQKELETAVAIDPQYADAHFNLAVVFATQQPPNKEPARKHYQMAVSLGAEPDTNLEQLIK